VHLDAIFCVVDTDAINSSLLQCNDPGIAVDHGSSAQAHDGQHAVEAAVPSFISHADNHIHSADCSHHEHVDHASQSHKHTHTHNDDAHDEHECKDTAVSAVLPFHQRRTVLSQLRNADIVVLNKTDLVDADG